MGLVTNLGGVSKKQINIAIPRKTPTWQCWGEKGVFAMKIYGTIFQPKWGHDDDVPSSQWKNPQPVDIFLGYILHENSKPRVSAMGWPKRLSQQGQNCSLPLNHKINGYQQLSMAITRGYPSYLTDEATIGSLSFFQDLVEYLQSCHVDLSGSLVLRHRVLARRGYSFHFCWDDVIDLPAMTSWEC